MPILDVEIVVPAGESVSNYIVKEIAAAASEILGAEPSRTWVRARPLPAEQYAEGDGGPPDDIRPVFVTVLRAASPGPTLQRDQAEALAKAVADVCKRPIENVHVLFEPSAQGRIAFGGDLREEP